MQNSEALLNFVSALSGAGTCCTVRSGVPHNSPFLHDCFSIVPNDKFLKDDFYQYFFYTLPRLSCGHLPQGWTPLRR